jgi:hypothetical protein
VAAAINLAGLRIHDLRHTAMALWIAAGALGWESGEVRRQGLEPRTVALRGKFRRIT